MRVLANALKIGERLHLNYESLEKLTLAAMLHDIGKVKIPANILNKPGKLTNKEYDIVKKHPFYGFEMIHKLANPSIANIILQHHERLDGSGYPYGLYENQILIEAKIIAISDSFDAMTEDRVYRKGSPPHVAFQEIESLSGVYYDNEVVEAFGEVLYEGDYF